MKYLRQRYILFEYFIDSDQSIPEEPIVQAIWKQLIHFFGEYNTFHVGLWMIRYDAAHRIGILRCDNITKTQVIASLALIKTVQNYSIVFHTRKTTGTIKKALELWREAFNLTPPPAPNNENKK